MDVVPHMHTSPQVCVEAHMKAVPHTHAFTCVFQSASRQRLIHRSLWFVCSLYENSVSYTYLRMHVHSMNKDSTSQTHLCMFVYKSAWRQCISHISTCVQLIWTWCLMHRCLACSCAVCLWIVPHTSVHVCIVSNLYEDSASYTHCCMSMCCLYEDSASYIHCCMPVYEDSASYTLLYVCVQSAWSQCLIHTDVCLCAVYMKIVPHTHCCMSVYCVYEDSASYIHCCTSVYSLHEASASYTLLYVCVLFIWR